MNDIVEQLKGTIKLSKLNMRERKLIDARFEEEHEDEQRENNAKSFTAGAPKVPGAQIVYCQDKGIAGVAVEGFHKVCPLPKEYGGKGLELALVNDGLLVVIEPGLSPLVIDPVHGTTRKL